MKQLRRKPKLIFTVGLPASGKSTWSKEVAKKSHVTKRVSRDDLRTMFDDYEFNKVNEGIVWEWRNKMIVEFLRNGYDVILDETNLNPSRVEQTIEIVKQEGVEFSIEWKDFLDVPLEVCIDRDRNRERPVGEKVIRNFYKKWVLKRTPPSEERVYAEQDDRLPEAIIVDIDGTIALMNGRSPYEYDKVDTDVINTPVADIVGMFYDWGVHVILMSGRDGSSMEKTIEWANKNEIPFNDIYMRASGDTRKDSKVKKELFDENIKGKYNIIAVFDDRNQVVDMWRKELGLLTFQVWYGDF